MIKRTLLFTSPAYLHTRHEQLVVRVKGTDEDSTIPIEDIGVAVLEHQEIVLSQAALSKLLAGNVSVVVCDEKHLPAGLLLPLEGNTLQSERFTAQLAASVPLKKQLWQQTVSAKILNQALHLEYQRKPAETLRRLSRSVRSGDVDNSEAHAARTYWKTLFGSMSGDGEPFVRDRYGEPPNNLLNYGYAILRAAVARALVVSGLLPTLGIHHHNRYNAFCLADDVMEPFRPFVDCIAYSLYSHTPNRDFELTKDDKKALLQVLTAPTDVMGERSPLLIAVSQATSSLVKCFSGEARDLVYPRFTSPLTLSERTDEPEERDEKK